MCISPMTNTMITHASDSESMVWSSLPARCMAATPSRICSMLWSRDRLNTWRTFGCLTDA